MGNLTLDDLTKAYQKLRNHFYYEKHDIVTREKIMKYDRTRLGKLVDVINTEGTSFDRYIKRIKLSYYPKDFYQRDHKKEANYFSNHKINRSDPIDDFLIFIDAPVEVHLVSVLWIMRLGHFLDSSLGSYCYGNRLLSKNPQDKQLFRRYHYDYKMWWKNALDTARKTLEQKSDISILTLDIKAYYHSIEFDFRSIDETSYLKEKSQSSSRFLEKLLIKIHQEYKVKILQTGHPQVTNRDNRYPLPIGLLSSLILANYFLSDFDCLILDISPEYYGRYVDDIILVLRDRSSKVRTSNPMRKLIREKLGFILEEDLRYDEKDKLRQYRFVHPKYSNLVLQQNKMFLYEFSSKSAPSILNVMIEEQKQRSSEYRFLSDILDESFIDFENIVFESSFDFDDGNNAKFREVNEDKFKLASYLAKFIQKSIENGPDYRKPEIDKIYKFFKGKYYIKHYYFWEKLLTLFWIREEFTLFDRVVREIEQAIEGLKVSSKWKVAPQETKDSLIKYLDCSIRLAVNLNQDNNGIYKNYIDPKVVIRAHYSIFPFLPYTRAQRKFDLNFVDPTELELLKSNPQDLELLIDDIPTGKPFYWCYIYQFIFCTFSEEILKMDQVELLDRSFDLYQLINGSYISPEELYIIEQIEELSFEGRSVFEINAPSTSAHLSRVYRLALINQLVPESNFVSSLQGRPNMYSKRLASIRYELDEISRIDDLDIILKPELSIPYPSLFRQVAQSAKNQYSLNAGIEFISSTNYGFNFILTTLPIRIDETFSDSIPIIRLKNHYSYSEINLLAENLLQVPCKLNREYYIFRWRGLYFTNYYCFELTSIEDRSVFKSMIDLIVAPIWNRDSYYFRSIAEALVRDLHCFYAQCNTSDYPDTRVSQPTKSVFMEISSVHGGTILQPRFDFNFIITDFDVNKLRTYQLIPPVETVKEEFKKNEILKPLPPGWDVENVHRRINNESMVLDMEPDF